MHIAEPWIRFIDRKAGVPQNPYAGWVFKQYGSILTAKFSGMTSERSDFYYTVCLKRLLRFLLWVRVLDSWLITGNFKDHGCNSADCHGDYDDCCILGIFKQIVFTSHLVSLPFDVVHSLVCSRQIGL